MCVFSVFDQCDHESNIIRFHSDISVLHVDSEEISQLDLGDVVDNVLVIL